MPAGGKEVMPVSVSTAKVSLEPVVRQNSIRLKPIDYLTCCLHTVGRQ